MNIIGIIVGIATWLFIDIYLGIKVKNISDSKIQISKKFLLIGCNILLCIVVILIAISI